MTSDFAGRIEQLWDGAGLLELAGELDLSTAPLIEGQFQSLVERGLTEVVIDATNVTFMDSSGLHALLEGEKLIHREGSAVHLVPSRQVRRLLDLISAEPLLTSEFGTVEEAVAALERNRE